MNVPGLGDLVSKALSVVGLTEDRVSEFMGRPCGCKERRQRLNALTFWATRVLSGQTEKAKEYLDAITGETDP